MNVTKIFIASILLVSVSAGCTAGEANLQKRLYDIERGQAAQFATILPQLQKKRVVLVGEHHSTAAHHQAQLEVIRVLNTAGAKVAVGLEMFRSDSQDALDRWISGEMSENEFQAHFYDNWSYDWPLYRDIFIYARENGIPMLGLNVPREITRQVARQGYRSLNEEQRMKLGDVACRVDKEYMEFIRKAYGGHGHGDMGFLYFCEAQMVWDSVMAVNSLEYLKKNPERMMVILTGTGHARKQAIPYQIATRSDIAVGVVLPEVPGRIDPNTVDIGDADYIFLDLDPI